MLPIHILRNIILITILVAVVSVLVLGLVVEVYL